jgi:hypothetical protein
MAPPQAPTAPPQDSSWFRKLQPGEVAPPPPPELVAWANNTLMATLVGTLYGGARAHATREPPSPDVLPQARHAPLCRCPRGAALIRSRRHAGDAATLPRPPRARHGEHGLSGTPAAHAAAQCRGLTPLSRRDAQAGAFAAVFLGAQAYLEHKRGAGNWQNAAAAGGFTAGLLGLLSACPRTVFARLRSRR